MGDKKEGMGLEMYGNNCKFEGIFWLFKRLLSKYLFRAVFVRIKARIGEVYSLGWKCV